MTELSAPTATEATDNGPTIYERRPRGLTYYGTIAGLFVTAAVTAIAKDRA